MHHNTPIKAQIDSIIERARDRAHTSALGVQIVLDDAWRLIAFQLAREMTNPFIEVDWHSLDMGFLLQAWRDGIKEWRSAGFQGMTPRQIAIAAVLDDVDVADFRDDADVIARPFLGQPAEAFIRRTCESLLGAAGESVAQVAIDELPSQVKENQYAEAMAHGIPPGIHTEFCWVPGWDGESLDDLLADFTVPTRGPFRGIEDLYPSKGLANFLTWANVSILDLFDTAEIRNEGQGQKLREQLKGFEIAKDYNRARMLSPDEIIDIIENSTSSSVPVVHCEIDVDALLKLDPRQSFALPLRHGRMHVGLHDFLNGAGHMACYVGTPIVPGMSLGFAWPGRWEHGIDAVYGIVKHPFHCRPQTVEAPQQELLAA